MEFFTLVTSYGKAKLAESMAGSITWNPKFMAVGDSLGVYCDPIEEQTSLRNEVWRSTVNQISLHPDNPFWIVADLIIPSEIGGFYVREVGLFDDLNHLLAIGKFPGCDKPVGSFKQLYLQMIVEVSNAAAVSMLVNPNLILATQHSVDALMSTHEHAVDPHTQYLTRSEADQFYDSIGLAAEAINQDAARLSIHVAHADPHPQYLDATRAAELDKANWAERFFYAAGI